MSHLMNQKYSNYLHSVGVVVVGLCVVGVVEVILDGLQYLDPEMNLLLSTLDSILFKSLHNPVVVLNE